MSLHCTNTIFHHALAFEDYLQLPGVSFSSLKMEDQPPLVESPGMRMGKKVHQYLMQPSQYKWEENHAQVKAIALELKRFIIPGMTAEIPFTCELQSAGFSLQYRGVPDLAVYGHLVLDFKIIAGGLDGYMKRFGAIEQIRGYMNPCGASVGIIAAYNKIKQRVEVCQFGQDTGWWERQVLSRGKVISAPENSGVTK